MTDSQWFVVALCVIAAGWWLFGAIFLPVSKCSWCKGRGVNWWSGESREGNCWFCRGQPRRMTWSARLVRKPFRRWNR